MSKSSITPAEKLELILDACTAFAASEITEEELREFLGSLGLNATDIEEHIRENKPNLMGD